MQVDEPGSTGMLTLRGSSGSESSRNKDSDNRSSEVKKVGRKQHLHIATSEARLH